MRYIILAAGLLLSACAAPSREVMQVEPGQEFTLAAGGVARVSGREIRFDEVLEDSRCPMNARCVWEGNARVAFEIVRSGAVERVVLNTSERFEAKQESGDMMFRLVRLDPTPMAGEKVKEYTVVLIAEGKP